MGEQQSSSIVARRVFGWAMLIGYIGCFLVPAFLRHVLKLQVDPTWDSRCQVWVWYSLAGAASGVACWLALGDGNWMVRLLTAGWALVCTWIVWQLATYVAYWGEEDVPGSTKSGFSYAAAGQALFAFVVTLVPLATMRWVFGMRFVRPDDLGPLIPTPTQFTLAQLLCVVAIAALTLGVARVIAPTDLTYIAMFTIPKRNAGFALAATYYSIIVIPTAISIVFYPRRLHWALVYFAVTCIAVTFLEAFPSIGWRALRRLTLFFILNTVNYSVVLLVYASLLLLGLRALSYRLQWGRSKAAPDHTTMALATSSN